MDEAEDRVDVAGESPQDISGTKINPAKLTAMLRSKFETGSYEIRVCPPCSRIKH